VTDPGSGSLWEWFAARLSSAPRPEPLPRSVALFLQAGLRARAGDAWTALRLVEQVLVDPAAAPLLLGAAQSFRAAQLVTLGRPVEALAAARSATDAARRLESTDPGDAAALPRALRGEAALLAQEQLFAEALDAGEEAVRLARALRGDDGSELVGALRSLAAILGALDRKVDALPVVDEAVHVLRGLDPAQAHVRRALASSLALQADCLRELGRVAEQVASAREAVALRRGLPQDAAAHPQLVTGPLFLLASGLFKLSVAHARAGEPDAALVANGEALQVFRELEILAPGRHPDGIGLTLLNRGNMLLQSGWPQEAAEAYAGAVAALRTSSPDPAREPQLALALAHLTAAHLGMERFPEALASATEAAEIRERLFEDDPATMAVPFANALNTLAEAFLKCGQAAESRAMADWARELSALPG
jgi:hypothetical protein